MSRRLSRSARSSLYDSRLRGSTNGTKEGEREPNGSDGEGTTRAKATRYKFPDIRPFVSFEMGQFSRDLMVIAFLGGHIAFHPVQCVRPIYQSSSLSPGLGLSRIRVAVGGVDVERTEKGRGLTEAD